MLRSELINRARAIPKNIEKTATSATFTIPVERPTTVSLARSHNDAAHDGADCECAGPTTVHMKYSQGMHRSGKALLALLLASTPVARAATPTREPITIREPSLKGGSTALVTPEYREAVEKLQGIAARHPQGAPLRVASPAPCVLRLSRGNDVPAYTDAGHGFLHQVTWVDLSRSAQLGAEAFGRNRGSAPSMLATCAWLSGPPGLAVSTEVIALKGEVTPMRRIELAPEERPRICVGNEVEPEEVAAPLRRLVTLCGGRTVPIPQVEERSVPIEELLVTAWDAGLAERVQELAHDGNEAAVLEPLSLHPAAALVVVQHLSQSGRLLQRKLAPVLAGYLGRRAPSNLLDDLFESEVRRRADHRRADSGTRGDARDEAVNRVLEQVAERPGVAGYFDAQSVVEDIVYAAVRWCRDADRKKAGVALLRKVVERTIGGEYWNSSSAAMTGLTCDCGEDSRELLSRFSTWARGATAAEPSRPSLVQERNVAEELLVGKCVASIGSSRSGGANGDPLAAWDKRAKSGLRAFLFLAEAVK